MSETQDKIEELHEKLTKLTSDELILNLAVMIHTEKQYNPKAMLLLKTYLARALYREGIK